VTTNLAALSPFSFLACSVECVGKWTRNQWPKMREVRAGTEKSVWYETLGARTGSSAPRAVPSQPVQSHREFK
jgi:hypothetical protein